jgi:hypothetical protein
VPAPGIADAAATRALEEAFMLAAEDAEVVALLEARFGESNDWGTFLSAGERAVTKMRPSPKHVPLRLAMARICSDKLKRIDRATTHLTAAFELAPGDASMPAKLGQLQLSTGRADRALLEFQRALTLDAFHVEALRGVAQALGRGPAHECGQLLDLTADFLDGKPLPPNGSPLPPLTAKHPLLRDELLGLMPRAYAGQVRALADLVRMLEPFAPGLLVEVTGRIPRGDELPDAHPVYLRCRALTSSFGLPPMRVFVDSPDSNRAQLVADSRLALSVGKKLTTPSQQGALAFAVARLLPFITIEASLGAIVNAAELCAILQALLFEQQGSESLVDLRRRVTKPLPRRTRKDLERFALEQQIDLNRAGASWHAEELRAAERIALLISRDPATTLAWVAGSTDPAVVRQSQRAADLVRWLATDAAWRAYARLSAS